MRVAEIQCRLPVLQRVGGAYRITTAGPLSKFFLFLLQSHGRKRSSKLAHLLRIFANCLPYLFQVVAKAALLGSFHASWVNEWSETWPYMLRRIAEDINSNIADSFDLFE